MYDYNITSSILTSKKNKKKTLYIFQEFVVFSLANNVEITISFTENSDIFSKIHNISKSKGSNILYNPLVKNNKELLIRCFIRYDSNL